MKTELKRIAIQRESDTPRTDALVKQNHDSCDLHDMTLAFNKMLDLARQLERENKRLRELLAQGVNNFQAMQRGEVYPGQSWCDKARSALEGK